MNQNIQIFPTAFPFSPTFLPSPSEQESKHSLPQSENVMALKVPGFPDAEFANLPTGGEIIEYELGSVNGLRRGLAELLYDDGLCMHISPDGLICVSPSVINCAKSIHHIFPKSNFHNGGFNTAVGLFENELPLQIAQRLISWFEDNRDSGAIFAGNFLANLLLLPNSTHQGKAFDILHRPCARGVVDGLSMNLKYILFSINVFTIAAKSNLLLNKVNTRYTYSGPEEECYRVKLNDEINFNRDLASLISKMSPNLYDFWLNNFGVAGRVTLEH